MANSRRPSPRQPGSAFIRFGGDPGHRRDCARMSNGSIIPFAGRAGECGDRHVPGVASTTPRRPVCQSAVRALRSRSPAWRRRSGDGGRRSIPRTAVDATASATASGLRSCSSPYQVMVDSTTPNTRSVTVWLGRSTTRPVLAVSSIRARYRSRSWSRLAQNCAESGPPGLGHQLQGAEVGRPRAEVASVLAGQGIQAHFGLGLGGVDPGRGRECRSHRPVEQLGEEVVLVGEVVKQRCLP